MLFTNKFSTLLITTIISTSQLFSANINNNWDISGNLKAGYVNYQRPTLDSYGLYTVPKVSVTSPDYNGFSAKTTVAAVTDFGLNTYDKGNLVFDPIDNKSFAILQELYLSYKNNSHKLIIGRQELVTPLLEADDYYFLADSYEALNYINSSINNLDIHLGYVYRMSGVWDSGANGTEFHSMSDASFVDSRDKSNANNSGVIYGGLEYSIDKYSIKVWEYYIKDLYNIALVEYAFSSSINSFSYDIGAQFVDYSELGQLASNNFTNIDYQIYSVKFDGKFDNGLSFATGLTKYSDGEGQAATLGAYGGFPSYTYGLIYSYWGVGNLRNASLVKIQLAYDLAMLGLKNTKLTYRYINYNLDAKYANSTAKNKTQLNGVKLSYTPSNGIYLYATYEHSKPDITENSSGVRLIGGYKF